MSLFDAFKKEIPYLFLKYLIAMHSSLNTANPTLKMEF
jgi:hypothetical protein